MARLLLFFAHADHSSSAAAAVAPLAQLLLVAFVVAAVVVSLCTTSTHAKLWRQRGTNAPTVKPADGGGSVATSRKHMLATSLSGIGGKAARMVSWNRRSPAVSGGSSDEEEVAVEDEEALWRKAIIMGEKCRPLQFSGHIAFDSDGNQLPPAKKDDANVAVAATEK